jgi:abequosyltransferase
MTMSFTSPFLSICIPSYNRGKLLSDLLDRIADDLSGELQDLVEVVVTDNASPYATPAVIERHRTRIAQLTYVRHAENIGPDRNFLASVAAAKGQYCWLMGDDDMLEPGSVSRIVQILHEQPGLCGLSMDRYARSFDLQTRLSEDVFADFAGTTLLNGAEEVFQRIVDYVAFLSAQVVHRETWVAVVRDCPVEQFLNSYVHVYVIAHMLRRNPAWMVLKERLVSWRADNDSFLGAGRYRRIEIDVVGFEQIARAAFGAGSTTYRVIRDRIATRNLRMMITSSRIEGSWDRDTRQRTIKLAMTHYAKSAKFWLVTAPFLFAPSEVLPVLRYAQQRVHARRAQRVATAD